MHLPKIVVHLVKTTALKACQILGEVWHGRESPNLVYIINNKSEAFLRTNVRVDARDVWWHHEFHVEAFVALVVAQGRISELPIVRTALRNGGWLMLLRVMGL